MLYTLRHFDTPVLRFSAASGAELEIQIQWVTDNTALLPLDLPEVSPAGIETWIRHRTVPRNRAYVSSLLSAMGLSLNRPMDIIRVSKGLSLNDCYWVTDEAFKGSFDRFNLYDNRFNRTLGWIAFTGYGSSNPSGLTSSPEFTTNGMLAKCWRRERGKIRLYKSGTEGAANTGNEPYSEYYAAMIAKQEFCRRHDCRPEDVGVFFITPCPAKMTAIRSTGNDEAMKLVPARVFSLEEALEFINDDELVEIVPDDIRLRKKILSELDRRRQRRR